LYSVGVPRCRGLSSLIVVAALMLPEAGAPRAHVVAASGIQDPPQCTLSADEERALQSASYGDFDLGTGTGGWRALLNRGCPATASAAIARYIATHRRALAGEELRLLHFHQGQTLALAGRHQDAIGPLRESLAGQPTREWAAYVEATIAFLDSDRTALRSARDRYAAESSPGATRLRIIDGLIACFAKPYAEAWMCPAR
jgi:hypothetical protein